MSWSVKWRVSAMMFLQYAIWGAWAPFLWNYLQNTESIPAGQVGFIFGLLALACILAPFTGGQIADRWVPTQKFLGVAHLLGGLCLVQAARAHGFMPVALWMGGFCLVYAPTLALTNSLGFHHIGDEKTFGKIRVFGTLGWIFAACVLSVWRDPRSLVTYCESAVILLLFAALYRSLLAALLTRASRAVSVLVTVAWSAGGLVLAVWRYHSGPASWSSPAIESLAKQIPAIPVHTADCLMLAGIFGLLLGFLCFFLPNTPPAKDKAADPWAFREAFVLLKNRNFLIFMAIAFVVTTELQFYYGPTEAFLGQVLKIPAGKTPMVLAVAQMAEIIAMAFVLRHALRNWGVRKTLAIGTIVWPMRYIVFALAPLGPLAIMKPLVIASLTLHGLGYTFFFVASQIYVDMVAPKDIRASAQSLLALVTLGVGTWLGSQFTGFIMAYFHPATNAHNWTPFFLVPCALTVACAIAFLLFFKDVKAEAKVEAQ